jgi:hypothetical protein
MSQRENSVKTCIAFISSRVRCLKPCLQSLWENYNHKNNYPVYVFYFDDIYDSEELREHIIGETNQNVIFSSVPYKTPSFIEESEMFYNRNDIWYSRTQFPLQRKGYLHMCHFVSNFYGYPNTDLEQYDYIITHDDESGYDKPLYIDPTIILQEKSLLFGAFKTGKRFRDGKPHQGHLDTRIGLWNLTKEFILENNITPKNNELNALLNDPNAEQNFHLLDWCDTYVIDTKMFKLDLWSKWISKVNAAGGIYKYRWGDNEIYSLFVNMIQANIYNLDLVDTGIHNQGKFRHLQDWAPGVKDLNR